MNPCRTTLPADAAALLSEYYRYVDLAEHVRALPEAAAVLGMQNAAAEHEGILAELEAEILTRLERLDALGLYPTTTTAVDVSVNGIPITLPELCRESNELPDLGSRTKESCMHTVIEQSEQHDQQNGLDRSLETPSDGPGFLATYVRPYLGYAATFAVGAMCGAIGTHYFNAKENLELNA